MSLKLKEASSGQIDVRVQVPQEANGAYYHMETDVAYGIKFEGSGTLVAGTNIISLDCNGAIPTQTGTATFRLTNNSLDPLATERLISIPVAGTTINVKVHCNNGDWNLITGNERGGVELILKNKAIFGLGNSTSTTICPVEAINITSSNSATTTSFSGIDIVILSYDINPSSSMQTALINFVKAGGVLIHCINQGQAANGLAIINGLIGSGISLTEIGTQIATLNAGSAIVEGEYHNLKDKKIGYDGGGNQYFTIPSSLTSQVEILGKFSSGNITAFKSKTYRYVVFGDGGPFCGGTSAWTSGIDDFRPLQVKSDGTPEIRRKTSTYNVDTYNAHLFVNTMIWAIRERQK